MQNLVEGIHRFQREAFSQDQKLFETLADGSTHWLCLSRARPNAPANFVLESEGLALSLRSVRWQPSVSLKNFDDYNFEMLLCMYGQI